jgi:hypothetical protein
MGLHVGVFCPEKAPGAFASEVLDDVGELAAAIVAFPGIPLLCAKFQRRLK